MNNQNLTNNILKLNKKINKLENKLENTVDTNQNLPNIEYTTQQNNIISEDTNQSNDLLSRYSINILDVIICIYLIVLFSYKFFPNVMFSYN